MIVPDETVVEAISVRGDGEDAQECRRRNRTEFGCWQLGERGGFVVEAAGDVVDVGRPLFLFAFI